MLLDISRERTITDVQHEFNMWFPYLRLEFYKLQEADPALIVKKHLEPSLQLKLAGLRKGGVLEVSDDMTVGSLEKSFRERFGLEVQVSRKSGLLWLQTTMTDNWTLQKQNEYGREISTRA